MLKSSVLCLLLLGQNVSTSGPDGRNYTDQPSILRHLTTLEQTVASLRTSNSQLQTDLQLMKNDLQAELRSTKTDLQAVLSELSASKAQQGLVNAEVSSLKGDVASLTAKLKASSNELSLVRSQLTNARSAMAAGSVAFHAYKPNNPAAATPITFSTTLYNTGGGYNSNTGTFTAPASGIYMFWTQMQIFQLNSYINVFIKKSGNVIIGAGVAHADATFSNTAAAAAVLVANFDKGGEVWVETDGPHVYRSYASYFGGAILSASDN